MEDVTTKNVVPRQLADLVIRCVDEGWPQLPVEIFEEKK